MPKKIKILFTIPNFDTAGSGKVVLSLAQGLDKEKFIAEICTTSNKGSFFETVQGSGIKLHVFNYLAPRKLGWEFFKSVFQTFRFFKSCNPDIIHSYHYASEFSEGLAARLAGCKWIFTKKNMAWSNKGWYLRSLLANRIIATNQSIKHTFYPSSSKIEVIYSSVNTVNFPFSERENLLRNFIVVGNIAPIKGTETIIRAFLSYCDRYPGNLIFVGNDTNEYAKSIKLDIELSEHKNRIVFEGPKADIRYYFDQSFCLIMASDKNGEGGPVALLEAMAHGLLVIGSKVPGINEQLQNFPELLFEPNDSNALLNKMAEMFNSTDAKISSLRKALRAEVEHRFSVETEIENHELLYKQLLI